VCFCKSPEVLKDLRQLSSRQRYGFSPVCVLTWLLRPYPEESGKKNKMLVQINWRITETCLWKQSLPVANFLPQPICSQMYGLSPVCDLSCTYKYLENDIFKKLTSKSTAETKDTCEQKTFRKSSLLHNFTFRWWAVVYSFPHPSCSHRKAFSPTCWILGDRLSWPCSTIW